MDEFVPFGHRRRVQRWRQITVAALCSGLLLAGCSAKETLRAVGVVQSSYGGAVGDEPRSVIVARDVLAAGGSAADAAVALYFTAAVTYPAAASLGAGGACLVYDPEDDRTEALEFPAVAPSRIDPGATRRNAVPGAVRGMAALHARYGRLQWKQLLGPAEQLARLGHPVSRALARDLALAAAPLFADAPTAAVFGGAGGAPLREGDRAVQLDLGAVITQIRTRGAGDFYTGDLARKLVVAVGRAGGSLGIEDLRDYRPAWRETVSLPFANERIHTLPPPAVGGVTLLQMWAMLTEDDRYDDAGPDERGHLLAEASMRALADRGAWLPRLGGGVAVDELISGDRVARLMAGYRADRHAPARTLSPPPVARSENPAAASFAVVDGKGSAVACVVTLNNLFGVGRMAPGTGIILAAAPHSSPPAAHSAAPVLVVNHNTDELLFAGAAAGGVTAPSALVEVMARTLIDGMPLARAVTAPRLFHGGLPDVVFTEPGEKGPRLDGLIGRGYEVAEVPEIGRVNAVHCAGGFQATGQSCVYSSDERGFGLATLAQF